MLKRDGVALLLDSLDSCSVHVDRPRAVRQHIFCDSADERAAGDRDRLHGGANSLGVACVF